MGGGGVGSIRNRFVTYSVAREQYHKCGMWAEAEEAFEDTLQVIEEYFDAEHASVCVHAPKISLHLVMAPLSICSSFPSNSTGWHCAE